MSENNTIYEITKKISDPNTVRNDLQEIMELVAKHFKQKYIQSLEVAIAQHNEHCIKNPSKELVLLNACRPFLGENVGFLNTLGSALQTLNVINNITSEFSPKALYNASQIEDNSIHADGIYDIDNQCMTKDNTVNSSSLFSNNDSSYIYIILIVVLLFFSNKK